jgi:hypothetical protein
MVLMMRMAMNRFGHPAERSQRPAAKQNTPKMK